jgi:hypothetical protein
MQPPLFKFFIACLTGNIGLKIVLAYKILLCIKIFSTYQKGLTLLELKKAKEIK